MKDLSEKRFDDELGVIFAEGVSGVWSRTKPLPSSDDSKNDRPTELKLNSRGGGGCRLMPAMEQSGEMSVSGMEQSDFPEAPAAEAVFWDEMLFFCR